MTKGANQQALADRHAEVKAKGVRCPLCTSDKIGIVVTESGEPDGDGQVFCTKCDFVFTA